MNRRDEQAAPASQARLRRRLKARIYRLRFEPLEDRTMLSGSGQLPPAIVIGRTLATPSTADTATPSPSYFVGEVENNQVTITISVYNQQADPETGVLVTDTLAPGVTLAGASQPPDRNGQDLAWSLGTIPGYERASVSMTVNLPNASTLQIDTGANAFAMLDAGAVSASTPAAALRPGNVSDPSLLASTLDANTTDPFIQEQAAQLSYDPQQIFNFLQTQIDYNSYLGSVRGARGTLWSGAGNALDVASLGVALMRASGIPSQYAQGTLSQVQAGQLIDSMFPPSYKALGAVAPGLTASDPASDPTLLSETTQHDWFQFNTGSGMQDADPLIAGSTIGQAPTTATGTFTAVPDNLEEKTEIQLSAETYSAAGALFGQGPSTTTVLDQTFDDVALVGRPITVGNFVSTQALGGLIFTTTTNTYTPYIELSDEANPDPSQDEVIHGQSYQEVLTNFPLGSQILTGLFLNITLSGPQGAPATYEKTLVDRIGFAVRQGGGGNIVLPPISPTGQPILTNNDLWTINALPGLQSPTVIGGVSDVLNKLQDQLNVLLPTVNAISSTSPLTPEQQAAVDQSGSLNREIALLGNIALTVAFARASDRATAQLETCYQTLSYDVSPRLLVASTQQNGANLSAAIDLVKDDARDIEFPGQSFGVSFFFEQMRGYFDSALEGQVLSAATGQQAVTFDAVTQALAAQGGRLVLITQDSLNVLDGLSLSPDAKARITQEVNAGFGVVAPTQMVTINGQLTVEWLQVNFATGQVISVAPNGGHQAAVEYAFALDNPLNVAAAAFIGTMDGFAVSQLKFVGLFLGGIASGKDLVDIVRDAKIELSIDLAKDYIALLGGAIPVPEGLPEWESLGAEIAKSIFGLAVKGDLFNPLQVGAEVIKLILGKTLPGFSNLSLAFDAGMVAGSAYGIYYIATTLPGDPPLFPALTAEVTSPSPVNFATGSVTVAAGPAPSHLSLTVDTSSLAVSNQIAATWSSSSASGFQVGSLERHRRDRHRCERQVGRLRHGRAGRHGSHRRDHLGQRSIQRQRHGQPLLLRAGRQPADGLRLLDDLLGHGQRDRLDHAHDRRPLDQRHHPPGRHVHDIGPIVHDRGQRAEHLAELQRFGVDHGLRRHHQSRSMDRHARGRRRPAQSFERGHLHRVLGHDHAYGRQQLGRGHPQRRRGRRAPGHGEPVGGHDQPECARDVPDESPGQPGRYLYALGPGADGLDGLDRRQWQGHRGPRTRPPGRDVPDPDHRHIQLEPGPRRSDDGERDDLADEGGPRADGRPRPALHGAVQWRGAPHGLPRHDPEPRPGRRHL